MQCNVCSSTLPRSCGRLAFDSPEPPPNKSPSTAESIHDSVLESRVVLVVKVSMDLVFV